MLEVRVIGELDIRLDGITGELPPSRRVRALLGWLAIHPGRHSRSRLAGLFWPDVPETSARASLRSAIWALRSALGPGFAGYLVTDRDTVTLANRDPTWTCMRSGGSSGRGSLGRRSCCAVGTCCRILMQQLGRGGSRRAGGRHRNGPARRDGAGQQGRRPGHGARLRPPPGRAAPTGRGRRI